MIEFDREVAEESYVAMGRAVLKALLEEGWARHDALPQGPEKTRVFRQELVPMAVAKARLEKEEREREKEERRKPAQAVVDVEVNHVMVQCSLSGDEVGPIWGTSDRSVRRALATLSKECSCGRRFHEEAEE